MNRILILLLTITLASTVYSCKKESKNCRIASTSHQSSPSHAFSYNSQGKVSRITHSTGEYTDYVYTLSDTMYIRDYNVAGGLSEQRTCLLNNAGYILKEIYSNGDMNTFTYNVDNQLLHAYWVRANQHVDYVYDNNGNMTVGPCGILFTEFYPQENSANIEPMHMGYLALTGLYGKFSKHLPKTEQLPYLTSTGYVYFNYQYSFNDKGYVLSFTRDYTLTESYVYDCY